MTETTVLERTLAALAQLGLTVLAQNEPRGARHVQADAWLRVGKGKAQATYVVECKHMVTPATLGAVVTQLRHYANAAQRPALLITDYLTPPVAEKLRVHEQQFADAAGNAYLAGPGFLVYVTGRRPTQRQTTPRASKAFTTAGLKILFAFICDPTLADARHRAIAAAAGVALGAVPGVLADLQATSLLLVADKRRRLNATKRLLDEWALAYARTLRAKTLQAAYTTQNFGTWREWALDPQRVRWGAEPAAALLVGHLRPGMLTLYTDRLPPRLMVEQRFVQAGRLATERIVEIRKPFWGGKLHAEGRPGTVPPALVYADLLATGDGRCIETAQMVYDRHLARLLPAA
jgi:hypothetical protein